jgi:hypothetical protein
MKVNSQLHALDALTLGKDLSVSIRLEAEWATELVWMMWRRETSPDLAENLSPVIQPTANHYSDLSYPGSCGVFVS